MCSSLVPPSGVQATFPHTFLLPHASGSAFGLLEFLQEEHGDVDVEVLKVSFGANLP